MRVSKFLLAVVFGISIATPAFATFHRIQIEQVIVGVNGDPTAQAVQLRLRATFENQTQNTLLRVVDAAGANPLLLVNMGSAVVQGTGRRVLIATPSFQTVPPITPDFVMSAIPASYFAAGSLQFQQDPPGNLIYWRLSWGGAGYTGPGTGTLDNDVDGVFNPPFSGPLPQNNGQSILFQFAATALSTTNLNDYALTSGAATFTNNAGLSGTVPVPVPAEPQTWGRIKSSYR